MLFKIVNDNKVIVLKVKSASNEQYSCNFNEYYEKLKRISEKANVYNVVINFENVTFMNSIAISYVFRLFSFLKSRGGNLRISNVENDHLKSIFSVIEIDKIVNIYEKEEDAIMF